MLKFNEALLQFIWQYRLLKPALLFTTSGKQILILKPGLLNRDAGPDFSDAQIHINGLVLVGNIEIHLKTSDWLKHKHNLNKSYNTLILHVVYEHDVELEQNIKYQVEVLELKTLVDEKTLTAYCDLMDAKEKLACNGQLGRVDGIKFSNWLERMTVERLEEKVKRFENLYQVFNSDYTQTMYAVLLRNFGFHINALPFELISKQLPVYLLLKHTDNRLQLEALLLGISGFLDQQFEDKYLRQLQNEFDYLKNKYHLQPLKKEIFKFSKLRPANFPTVRLAQFAALIHSQSQLITAPQEFNSYSKLKTALHIAPDGYWKNRYVPDGEATIKTVSLGESSADILVINTFAPFFFFYGKKLGKPEFFELAIRLLQQASFERNSKTNLFQTKKECLTSGADSQGIIHLYDTYCSKKQCLKCGIAAAILKSA